MASYKIEWKQSARKELKGLGKPAIPRILKAVETLAEDPHPTGSRKIRGADRTYRVRVGDYRVVYSVEYNRLLVEIIRVGHRKEVYEKLI